MKPIVALVGRPNVGKSTLFNRITRSRDAIVDNMPGVTRDRNFGDALWNEIPFTLVDTGGFLNEDSDGFAAEIRFQVNQAIESAHAIVLVLDGKAGASPFDTDLISLLRGVEKPVFHVVNKIDGPEREPALYDFYSLGIDHPFPVSAEHGYGVSDFLDELVQSLPEPQPAEDENIIKVAVVGRPNVGKSSLVNHIVGEQRLVVTDIPGTTRDSIDTICQADGQTYLFIDTAGIRRKSKVSQKLEKFSIIKSLNSLERCDIALVLFDASEGITEQDVTIAGYAHERHRGCLLLLNKWDVVEKDRQTARNSIDELRYKAKFLQYAPAMTMSAKTGLRVHKIFPMIQEVHGQFTTRVGTGVFNRILENAVKRNEPSLVRGRRIKFYYGTQISTAPPTFICFVNYPESIHFSYTRYLINHIRIETGLDKTPIRLFYRLRGADSDTRKPGRKPPKRTLSKRGKKR